MQLPFIQRFFLKRIGAVIPFHPHSGRWFLPIPRKENITVVVGKPIPVAQKLNPSAEDVNKVMDLYLLELKRVFEKYKNELYKEKDRQLVFINAEGRVHQLPTQ